MATFNCNLNYRLNSYMKTILEVIISNISEILTENGYTNYTSILPQTIFVAKYTTTTPNITVASLLRKTLNINVENPADASFSKLHYQNNTIYADLKYDQHFFTSWFTNVDDKLQPQAPQMIPLMTAPGLATKLMTRLSKIINKSTFSFRLYPQDWSLTFPDHPQEEPLVLLTKPTGPELITRERLKHWENDLMAKRREQLQQKRQPVLPENLTNIEDMDAFHEQAQQQQGGGAAALPQENINMDSLIRIFQHISNQLDANVQEDRPTSPLSQT